MCMSSKTVLTDVLAVLWHRLIVTVWSLLFSCGRVCRLFAYKPFLLTHKSCILSHESQ